MFKDESQLNAMAQMAKQQLARQQSEVVDYNDDIYAELREDTYSSDLSDVNFDNRVSVNISNDTEEYDYDYSKINNEPTEEYYDEYPEYNIDTFGGTAIYPGGPSKAMVDSWKKQWEGYGVFITEVMGKKFIFRTLNRVEYKQIVALQNIDALQREEIICETVTLWPMNYTWDIMATGDAGIPSTFAEIIMSKSGFTKDYSIQVL